MKSLSNRARGIKDFVMTALKFSLLKIVKMGEGCLSKITEICVMSIMINPLPCNIQNKVLDVICSLLIFQEISVVCALNDMMVNLELNQNWVKRGPQNITRWQWILDFFCSTNTTHCNTQPLNLDIRTLSLLGITQYHWMPSDLCCYSKHKSHSCYFRRPI